MGSFLATFGDENDAGVSVNSSSVKFNPLLSFESGSSMALCGAEQ
jgi:hypothetical protein